MYRYPVGVSQAKNPFKEQPAMSDAYITVSDDSFKRDVLESATPVVVDFWAPWCGPCRQMAPAFEDLAREYTGKMTFAKLNTDENQNTMMHYGIQGIPTLLFFANGKLVEQLVGARPKSDLKQHVERVLATAAKVS
jgi:thioredoxin 1